MNAAIKRKPGVHFGGDPRTANKRPGGGQEGEGQRELAHHQHMAHLNTRATALGEFAGLFLQCREDVGT